MQEPYSIIILIWSFHYWVYGTQIWFLFGHSDWEKTQL